MNRSESGEILERLIPYVPPNWVSQAVADLEHTLAGREERLHAAVLFCDISGFTPIAEALSRRGREGIEELSALLDRYLTTMSELVVTLGGQVAKFAGDSLIALFPRVDAGEVHLGSALTCALRMRQLVSGFARLYTSAGTFPVQCKIGISEGPVYTTTVGDDEGGLLPLFAGRPLVRAMLAEDCADASEIVVDAVLTGRLPGHLDIGEARGTFRLVNDATDVPTLPAAQATNVSGLERERAAQLVRRLSPYLPSQAIDRLYQGSRGVYSEYRRVTVMFVRFEGPDNDSSPGDGLSAGEVLQAYCSAMRDCILRHGGRLNEVDMTLGGGTLVAFFGAPTAHEDDELRAVSCAWEMRQVLAEVGRAIGQQAGGQVCPDLRQCMGISSGTLFVGDIGGAVRRGYAAVGDEVNLASRLSHLAQWGETLVTSWIQWRAGGRFEFEAKGEVEIRGKAERVPIGLLRAPRPLGEGNRLLARLLNHPLLVGRTAEWAAIESVATQARQGEPQLLFLSGEAGVGKSRLVGDLVHKWSQSGGTIYAADCADGYDGDGDRRDNGAAGPDARDGTDPWIALLNAAFGLEDKDEPERRRHKVQSALALLSPSVAIPSALYEHLLIPGSDVEATPVPRRRRVGPTKRRAEERRANLCRALAGLIQSAAQQRPVLLVLESVHQLDPGSWALLGDLLYDLAGLPVLVCATCRPTGDEEAEGGPFPGTPVTTTQLVLEPLAEADSFYLAQHLIQDVGLQADLAPALVRQARGNPLYLQEMVHALAGSECPAEALAQGLIVPDRIAHTVLAQLDPLGEDYKLTLRIAAVIGQTFSLRLLQAAHPVFISRHDLAVRLARLERMHIVRLHHLTADARPPDVYYRFRHALAQQVIYASLLRADRERFHRRVGQALEWVASETSSVGSCTGVDVETTYGVLADHFQRGNVLPKALCYALLAGQHATRTRAVREALAYYDWAQDLLLAYERSAAARTWRCAQGVRISLLLGRGSVYYQLVDIAGAKEDYERALGLAGDLADLKSQADALLLLGEIAMRQADYVQAQTSIHQAIQRLSVLNETDLLARARLLLSRIHALRGGLPETKHYVTLAAELQRKGREPDRGIGWSIDAYEEWLGTVYLTDSPALVRRDGQGADDGEDVDRLLWLAEVAVQRGKWGDALGLARQGMALGWASGTPLDVAEAKRVLALTLAQAGAYQEAHDYLDEALATFAEANWTTGLAGGYWLAGEVLLALERHELAAERFDQALTLGKTTHTIQAVVRAQVGLGKLAAARAQWREGQRFCTEARARAASAGLGASAIAARLGLAGAYLGGQEWRAARRQAKQALDMAYQLGFPGDVLDAASMLGETLAGLGQAERAQQRFREAYEVAVQLADTLPPFYARAFWDKPSMRALRDHVGR
jgi:class 3 adenylate cyclase/tetratricopeptide (TPR) repeat protein